MDGNSNYSDMSMSTVTYLQEFEGKMHHFHQFYSRKVCILIKQTEFSQTRQECHRSEESIFIPFGPVEP